MKKFVLILPLLASTILSAQPGETNRPESVQHILRFSVAHHQFLEKNLHDKPFKGVGYEIAYEQVRKKENYSSLQFSLFNSHSKTNIEHKPGNLNASVRMGYDYLFKVVQNPHLNYYIGPGSLLHYNVGFLPNWDESHLYWANSFHFNLSQRLEFRPIEDKKISLVVRLPIVGGLSKPDETREYKMDDFSGTGILKAFHSQIDFSNPIKNFQVLTQAEYLFPFKSNGLRGVCYQINYFNFRTSNSQNSRFITHSLGFRWHL